MSHSFGEVVVVDVDITYMILEHNFCLRFLNERFDLEIEAVWNTAI